jgi:hypothetical protein
MQTCLHVVSTEKEPLVVSLLNTLDHLFYQLRVASPLDLMSVGSTSQTHVLRHASASGEVQIHVFSSTLPPSKSCAQSGPDTADSLYPIRRI